MEPDRWQAVQELVDRALAVDAAHRAAFLDEACDGDSELRDEVESLIAVDPEADRLVDEPIVDLRRCPSPSRVGDRIGPYELVEKIGEGGLGEVYLAERREPFVQRVAIKLIRAGMGSQEVLRRFDLERQILADLRHPHIAQLFEGGATDDGQPYFVMEWIDGQRLDRYCDDRKLDVEARLRLFLDVCSAVQVAHQRLVVHRDLKPGNVLVTRDGVVKLLDFGIAKLLPRGDSPHQTLTRRGFAPMTRQYASPEQATGHAITTASDVYSLGFLLYELLTGHRPYRLEDCDTFEKLRRICEQQPARPSTAIRLSEEVPSSGGTIAITPDSVSHARSGSPQRLRKRLAGDLDSILLKALRKRPENRYGSVEQLAEDIRRHLRGLPVLAREGTILYRSAKFLRRSRRRLLLAALALAVIAAAAASQISKRRAAEAHHARVQAESREASYRIEFLRNFFLRADVESGERFTTREFLDRGRRRFLENLKGESLATQLDILAGLYDDLDLLPEAGELWRKSLEILQGLDKSDPELLALALNNLASWHDRTGDHRQAEKLYRRSLDLRIRIGLRGDQLSVPRNNLASVFARKGDYASAKELYSKVLKIRERLYGRDHYLVARSLRSLGNIHYLEGDFERAQPLLRDALRIRLATFGRKDPKVAAAQSSLGRVLHGLGKLREAEQVLSAALATRREHYGENHRFVALTRRDLAAVFLDRGETAAAGALLAEALGTLGEEPGPAAAELAEARSLFGEVLLRERRYGEAEPYLIDGYRGLRDTRTTAAIQTHRAHRRLLDLYRTTKRPFPTSIETSPNAASGSG